MQPSIPTTMVQEGHVYLPAIQLDVDRVMVYGLNDSLLQRIDSWRDNGYGTGVMIGLSWGSYKDYFHGQWDGVRHWDTEVQVSRDGKPVLHGNSHDVAYLIPTDTFRDYLIQRLLSVVNHGIDEFYFEEPEFWVDSGYGEAFRQAWTSRYGTPWRGQHESSEAQWLTGKLKRDLYFELFDQVAGAIKQYGEQLGRTVRCYVATHSLINYAQWRLISPESGYLRSEHCDGFIAQVWTGTSRTPNVLRGTRQTRTFFTAFLEYGYFASMVRAKNLSLWALHDPIEDNPEYTWSDYKHHYLRTLVASLLHPEISRFEVCPWPNRIFQGRYKGETIPESYNAELRIIFRALRHLSQHQAEWVYEVSHVGVLVDDSALFQRPAESYAVKYDGTRHDDEYDAHTKEVVCWNEFFGLPLPLLESGIAVQPVPLQAAVIQPDILSRYRVLILSYQFMKPEWRDRHEVLRDWVVRGGTLLYVADDSDAFQSVPEWWNDFTGMTKPVHHLKAMLGCDSTYPDEDGTWEVGSGRFIEWRVNPADIALSPSLADDWVRKIGLALGGTREVNRTWLVRRGSYIAGMRFGDSQNPGHLEGVYVDLTQQDLPVLVNPPVSADQPIFWFDLTDANHGDIIASSVALQPVEIGAERWVYEVTAREGTPVAARIRLPHGPKSILFRVSSRLHSVDSTWDDTSSTVYIRFLCPFSGGCLEFDLS